MPVALPSPVVTTKTMSPDMAERLLQAVAAPLRVPGIEDETKEVSSAGSGTPWDSYDTWRAETRVGRRRKVIGHRRAGVGSTRDRGQSGAGVHHCVQGSGAG